jgi:hypothetical protein
MASLREQLKDARIVMTDDNHGLTLVWKGGHGIHAYNDEGREVSFWNTGNWAHQDASETEVRESMQNRIDTSDYP